jgi:hypothetical protein
MTRCLQGVTCCPPHATFDDHFVTEQMGIAVFGPSHTFFFNLKTPTNHLVKTILNLKTLSKALQSSLSSLNIEGPCCKKN